MSIVEENKGIHAEDYLRRYYYLEQEIQREKEEIAELQAKATRTTQSWSDMPGKKGLRDNTERIYAKLVDKKTDLCEKIAVAEHTRNEILRYISGIDDSLIRLILQYRYLNLLSWAKVAYFVGGNNTPDGVRKTAERFLKKDKVLERLSKEEAERK